MRSRHDKRRDREFPPRWLSALMLFAALACLAWTIWSINTSKQEADDATMSANALADQVEQACDEGSVKVDGRDICVKAQQVKKNVDQSQAGPAGPPGPRGMPGSRSTVPGPAGKPGQDGQDSDIPGPAGQPGGQGEQGGQGAPGEDSDIPGPAGQAGAPGKDSTIPGPAGAKGERGEKGESIVGPPGAKGEPGSKGEKGSSGRGISDVTCTADSDWLFEFTDGTSVTVAGPCRAQQAVPPPTTAPTTAP